MKTRIYAAPAVKGLKVKPALYYNILCRRRKCLGKWSQLPTSVGMSEQIVGMLLQGTN